MKVHGRDRDREREGQLADPSFNACDLCKGREGERERESARVGERERASD